MLVVFMTIGIQLRAHDLHYDHVDLREWHVEHQKHPIRASFYIFRDGQVYLEDAHEKILHFPLEQLSAEDRAFVANMVQRIETLNRSHEVMHRVVAPVSAPSFPVEKAAYGITAVMALLLVISFASGKRKFALPLFGLAAISALAGFTHSQLHTAQTTTDPLWMDSAFAPFKPTINTFWDTTYFHVESKGIPTTHSMMAGITKWQQQVPIPQCYIGTNSWSIPLNPVLANTPVPVSPQHFLRGAIAMAVNGIPIFNPYTNTGVDALLDGQLDNWGGHCGRADDYHYHIAPLHLYGSIPNTQPCAFGLDGYAVYGGFEPDGSSMLPLDTNNGHFGSNGVYHYHGVSAAPYMIHNMVGRVTEDTTLQIVPQARANPVRPSLTPLTGATLTGCTPNSTGNGYTVFYTLNGQLDSIQYSWTTNGRYTYNFYTTGNGIPVTQNYNGFTQCTVPTDVSTPAFSGNDISIYPNPAHESFRIRFTDPQVKAGIQSVTIYNIHGEAVYSNTVCPDFVSCSAWSKGVYFVVLAYPAGNSVKKIMID